MTQKSNLTQYKKGPSTDGVGAPPTKRYSAKQGRNNLKPAPVTGKK